MNICKIFKKSVIAGVWKKSIWAYTWRKIHVWAMVQLYNMTWNNNYREKEYKDKEKEKESK